MLQRSGWSVISGRWSVPARPPAGKALPGHQPLVHAGLGWVAGETREFAPLATEDIAPEVGGGVGEGVVGGGRRR